MRVAALDLGTNTTRLLVADVDGEQIEEVVKRTRITRLGEGVDARHRLLPLPMASARNCLTEYRGELESLGAERALLVATSAVRDAENGEAFLGEIEWSYGFTTRLLSGDEEADLTLRGVGRAGDSALILDIGGGSTELVGAAQRISLDIGAVRLTERHLPSDPPTDGELGACAAAVRSVLPDGPSPERAIGVAGTITSLAALDLALDEYDPEQVHGHRLTIGGVEQQLSRLAAMPLSERCQVPALDPERAPVIVAGAVILREVLAHFGLEEIEASERDILHGIALEAAALPEPVEGDAPPGAYTCC
jgi:exopolyphosphatase / guanosine-5'-triphosphate,3'-diphosphate pyrophosphatase